MKKFFFVSLMFVSLFLDSVAQIGYQVTVFDRVKMEPKANESVSAVVTISDNTGTQILSETHAGTTDEFGILSMTVGNTHSFDRANWENLPFWISASVDGITLSKTQILNVPVAEYAKKTGTLTSDILCAKTWTFTESTYGETVTIRLSFAKGGTGTYFFQEVYEGSVVKAENYSFQYNIDGDTVSWGNSNGRGGFCYYIPQLKQLRLMDDDSVKVN